VDLLPRAVAPTTEEFREVYTTLSQVTDKIISVHVSGKLNQACTHARNAADFSWAAAEIIVIDSWTICLGLSIWLRRRRGLLWQGATLDENSTSCSRMIPHVYAVFFTDTLQYLSATTT